MAWKRIGEGKREREAWRAPAETNNRTAEERDNDEGEQKERTREEKGKRETRSRGYEDILENEC